MMNRKEASEFVTKQMDLDNNREDKDAWHYGRVELRELFDAIYGGPPQNNNEKI